jgi:hypothetical protein
VAVKIDGHARPISLLCRSSKRSGSGVDVKNRIPAIVPFTLFLLFVAVPFASGGKSMDSHSVIFSSEETKELNTFGGEAPFWTPSVGQVQEMESLLLQYLTLHPPIDDKPVGNFFAYGRQYLGVTKKDRKLIYLNAFCDPSRFDQWKKGLILVKDGGSCYFQVYFDPAKKEFIHLHYNGQA